MVGLQIGPEQLAEQVGEALQRGEVHRRLAFAQVVDQHVAHRATGDLVAVDQLLAGRLPAAGEHLDRGRRVGAQDAVVAQQLIEQRAVGMHLAGGAHARGNLQELHAVTDPDRGDRPALGGQDDRDPGQGLLPGLQSDHAPRAQLGQRRKRRSVPGAGHLGGQPAARRGEAQQPVKAGPDHIGADQHQQTGAQVRQLRAGGCARPTTTSRGSGDHGPPVGLVLRAAGLPPLLPAVAGVGLQPGQHGQHPQPARLLAGQVAQREGSSQDLG